MAAVVENMMLVARGWSRMERGQRRTWWQLEWVQKGYRFEEDERVRDTAIINHICKSRNIYFIEHIVYTVQTTSCDSKKTENKRRIDVATSDPTLPKPYATYCFISLIIAIHDDLELNETLPSNQ